MLHDEPVNGDALVPARLHLPERGARVDGEVKRMAESAGCTAEFLSGAFFMRSKGSSLENSPAWLRFNLRWGGLFPGWPGEIYWLLRKK